MPDAVINVVRGETLRIYVAGFNHCRLSRRRVIVAGQALPDEVQTQPDDDFQVGNIERRRIWLIRLSQAEPDLQIIANSDRRGRRVGLAM